MGDTIPADEKQHAVGLPFLAQGHVTPMMKLVKVLHCKGFHVTFVNTEYNHCCLIRSRGPGAVAGLPDFRFATIPDGLPTSDADATQDTASLCYSTMTNCLPHFKEILADLNSAAVGVPSVTCVVADNVMSFSMDAARELRVPCALFWTASACGYMGHRHFQPLMDEGLAPLKDEEKLTNGYLDTPVGWARGMSKHIRSSLWREDHTCMKWLDCRKPRSVVYVNYGSVATMSNQQLVEFAWGLANCGYDFLWIVRNDLVKGDTAVLPPECQEATKDRCLLVSWCEQEVMLRHVAVGVFLAKRL